jgi:hypothetical protein
MATSLTNTRNALAQIMTKIASLESQGAGEHIDRKIFIYP